MAENTKISWTNTTWNPAQGCHRWDELCKNCYMHRQKENYGQDPTVVVRSKPATFNLPLKLREPQKVFVCSWSDFFLEEVDEWRAECWQIIKSTPHLTYQIPTKRTHRIAQCLPPDWGRGYPNVWLMASVGNPESMYRALELSSIPATVRGLSVEPLIEAIDPAQFRECIQDIDWLVYGGESGDIGTKYDPRPCPVDNMIELVGVAREMGKAVFVKQLGTLWAKQHGDPDDKGGTMELWPAELQVRQFPEVVR